jgi:hypothetical protein
MNNYDTRPRRRHWLVRYYLAQFRFYLRLHAMFRIMPPSTARSLITRLRPVEPGREL